MFAEYVGLQSSSDFNVIFFNSMASDSLNKFTETSFKVENLRNFIFLGVLQKLSSKMKRSECKSIKKSSEYKSIEL